MAMADEIAPAQLLEKLFAVIVEEARANPRFAKKLLGALPEQLVTAPPKPPRKPRKPQTPPVNLVGLLHREGEEGLRAFLKKRNKAQLRGLADRQHIPVAEEAYQQEAATVIDAMVEGVKFRLADRFAAAS